MTSDNNLADWDAAYVLGALTPDERTEYERFLSAEPAHAAALTQFTDIPGLLDVLTPDEALALIDEPAATAATDHPANPVPSLAAAAERRRHRTRRVRLTTALASAAAFLVVGGVVGYSAIPHPAGSTPTLEAMAPGQRAGITASLAVSHEEWGTRVDWQCQYTKDWAKNVTSYDLVVTTKDGKQTPVATWGPAQHAAQAENLAAATAIPTSDIRSVDIRVTGTTTPLATTTL
jgi:hypothetical protein